MQTRRHLLKSVIGGAAVTLAAPPLRAQDPLSAALERASGLDQMHGLIVMQNGEERLARRLNGPDLDRPVNIKSASKSLVALLLGIAIDAGDIAGVDATIGEVAPQLVPSGADEAVAGITMGDLVSLRAGLEGTSGGNYGGWVASGNWVANALSREMVAQPGGRMIYSTGSTHVLGAVLAEATGMSLLAQMRERLGRPLGLEIPPWTRDPQGYYMGGNEMALSARGLARVGEMVRQGGTFEGTRVVSSEWLTASLEGRTRSPYSGLSYGYGWFLGSASGQDYALARGYGGQVALIAPGAGLTVVVTSDPMRPARSAGYFGDIMDLLEDDIIGALA